MKTDKIAIKTYDYTGCDPDAKAKLISIAGSIVRQSKVGLEAMLAMGEDIAEAQSLLSKHKTGSFGKWIELECGIARQTAHNYMNAWKRFGQLSSLGQFSFEAIHLLAAPNAPPEAAKKAEIYADKGVKITGKFAKGLLPVKPSKNGKPPEPPKPPAATEPPASPQIAPKPSPKPTIKISPGFIAAGDIEAGEVVYTDLSRPEESQAAAELEAAVGSDILDFNPAALEAQPAATVNIKALAGPYKMAVLEIGRIVREFTALASVERTGVHLADKITRITHDLAEAREAISQSEPVQPCGKCNGAGCKSCFQSGFWTRAIVGSRKR